MSCVKMREIFFLINNFASVCFSSAFWESLKIRLSYPIKIRLQLPNLEVLKPISTIIKEIDCLKYQGTPFRLGPCFMSDPVSSRAGLMANWPNSSVTLNRLLKLEPAEKSGPVNLVDFCYCERPWTTTVEVTKRPPRELSKIF